MSQIEATKKSDLITLPRSSSTLVQVLTGAPTVLNLQAIGLVQPNNSYGEDGLFVGLQDTYLSMFADGTDIGFCSSELLMGVTGSVASIAVTAAGSGYTSAPTVSFTASSMQATPTITAGGSGYTAPPIITINGGGGAGALAVGLISPGGQVVGALIACTGWGYTSAGTVTVTSSNGLGGGATASANLATPVATATISAGQVTAVTVSALNVGPGSFSLWNQGAGYGSAGAAVISFSGGGGSGAAATATVVTGAPSLSAVGVGAGVHGTFNGGCTRLPNGQGKDGFARLNKDVFLGVVAATSGGTLRIFRSSY